MSDDEERPRRLSRRAVLGALVMGAAAACGATGGGDGDNTGAPTSTAGPGSSTPGTTAAATTSTGAPSSSSSSSTSSRSSTPSGQGSTTSTTAVEPASFVTRGSDGSDQVALTFHTNGDLALAQRLLDAVVVDDFQQGARHRQADRADS